MSKQNRKKKLEEHKMIDNLIVPGFLTIPNLKQTSWYDDRFPDLIWLGLLCNHYGINDSVFQFKKIAEFIVENNIRMRDIGLSDIGKLSDKDKQLLLSYICKELELGDILKSLLFFEMLPAREHWIKNLSDYTLDTNIVNTLISSTINFVDHQSDYSTFCRWCRVYYLIITERISAHESFVMDILAYPDVEDLRITRPSIRSFENALDLQEENISKQIWTTEFWNECFDKMECIYDGKKTYSRETEIELTKVYSSIIELDKFRDNNEKSNKLDPKFDGMFGMLTYSLKLIFDLVISNQTKNQVAQMVLRSIVEILITMKYIISLKNDGIWQEYRQYGQGQAKLIWLKNEEDSLFDDDYIKLITEEDRWMEFTSIKIGNWANTNLRNMAIKADIKDVYDKYYDITSSFVHGNWLAIRNSVYVNCLNPLHRFHRVIDLKDSNMPDTQCDIKSLINIMIDEFSVHYPGYDCKL